MVGERIILETERLYLREIGPADAENAYLLNLDREVLRYTGDVPFSSVEAAREFLEGYDHYRKYGFGRWAVIRKADEEFLGWCGLKYTPELDEYDIGFRLFRCYWNKGYASEAAEACLQLGFSKFGMQRIVGRVMTGNLASARVLEKIGLRFHAPYCFDGEAGAMYVLDKSV
jgi:RimJ/RimL family protein N-acetyltransferase